MGKENGGKLQKCREDHLMNTQVNTLMTRSVDRVNSNGHQATTTRVSIKMTKEMAMEKWCGLMEVDT
jgi:hypothetical protein